MATGNGIMKRMKHCQIARWVAVVGFTCGCLGIGVVPLQAQEGQDWAGLSWQALQKQTELATPVSIEAIRRELSALVQEAGGQANVELTLSPELVKANKLVTLRTNEMPLYDFMAALGRTYNAQWHEKGANSYELRLLPGSEADAMLAQVGTPLFYRYRDSVNPGKQQRSMQRGALYDQIVGELGQQNLSTKGGVPVASLSDETRELLRREYEKENALSLLMRQREYVKAIAPNTVLRLRSTQRELPRALQQVELSEELKTNRMILSLEILDERKHSLSTPAPLHWVVNRHQLNSQP